MLRYHSVRGISAPRSTLDLAWFLPASELSLEQLFCLDQDGSLKVDNLLNFFTWFIKSGPQLVRMDRIIIFGVFGSVTKVAIVCETDDRERGTMFPVSASRALVDVDEGQHRRCLDQQHNHLQHTWVKIGTQKFLDHGSRHDIRRIVCGVFQATRAAAT